VFSLLSRPHLLLSAGACCMARLQPGARITLAAINRYSLPAQRSAANPPHAAAAGDRCDRRTDERTDRHTTVA